MHVLKLCTCETLYVCSLTDVSTLLKGARLQSLFEDLARKSEKKEFRPKTSEWARARMRYLHFE